MNTTKNNIFDAVIKQDLCTGCGACLYTDNKEELQMDWNSEGFLVPIQKNNSAQAPETAIEHCPFNPYPADEVRTENELAEIFIKDAFNHHSNAGKYIDTYVGYSEQFRLTSSSGGIATYLLNKLFEMKLVDAVITVGDSMDNYFEYKLIRNKEDLLATSKTKYYPVTMAEALQELKTFEGKVAVVGIGCFIKAIRLLQYYYPELQEKIIFTVGIICGGLKSKFYCEYLAAKSGVKNNEFVRPEFRIKDYEKTAGDYSFGCIDNSGEPKKIKMSTIGDTWGTGLFKSKACDYCDDVFSELSDITLGDAWINPYNQDGKGTNVIATRSKLANNLIINGIKDKELHVEHLPIEKFLLSQNASVRHRQEALGYRIKLTSNENIFGLPPKRHINEKIGLDFKLVQKARLITRKQSLLLWKESKNKENFDKLMLPFLKKLYNLTMLNHILRGIKRRIGL